VVYNKDSILLTMAPDTVGTLMASTHYIWYGKVSATLTTSQGAGVVTAFILMSDAKDEIDFEFVGVDTQHVQSNYYFQGITNCKLAAGTKCGGILIQGQTTMAETYQPRTQNPRHTHTRSIGHRMS
jgi:hypothetical protein